MLSRASNGWVAGGPIVEVMINIACPVSSNSACDRFDIRMTRPDPNACGPVARLDLTEFRFGIGARHDRIGTPGAETAPGGGFSDDGTSPVRPFVCAARQT